MKPSLLKIALFTVFVLAINTFVLLAVCIAVSLILVRYLKRHSITAEDINYGKAVTKLGLFLRTYWQPNQFNKFHSFWSACIFHG